MKRTIGFVVLSLFLSWMVITIGSADATSGRQDTPAMPTASRQYADLPTASPGTSSGSSTLLTASVTSSPDPISPEEATSTPTPNMITPTPGDALPDLVLGRMSIQLEDPSQCPRTSTELGVLLEIINEAEGDSGPFSVKVNRKVIRVEPGLKAFQRIEIWFPGHSPRGLTSAKVDVYDEVIELDENNNGRFQQLPIPTPPPPCPPTPTPTHTPLPPETILPDLVITRVWFDLNTGGNCRMPESEVGLRVYISNIGNADAGAFSVELNDLLDRVEQGLRVGEKIDLWFREYMAPGSIAHAVVDVHGEVEEINEGNNEYDVQLPALTQALPCTATPTIPPTISTPSVTATPTNTPTITPSVTPTSTPSP